MKIRNLLRTAMTVLVLALWVSVGWGQTTVSYSFADVGAVTGLDVASPGVSLDANIGFGSFKNSGTSNPAIVSGQLRLYQNTTKGGSIKVYASNGVTITQVVVNASSVTGPAAFTVDGGGATVVSHVAGVYTMTGLSASSEVEFYCTGSSSSTRVYVDNFAVTYTSGASTSPAIANILQTPATDITSSTTVSVSADVTDDGSVASVVLNWGLSSGSLTNPISMSLGTGDTYTTDSDIPAQANGATVFYAITAIDNDTEETTTNERSYLVNDPATTEIPYTETFDADLGDCYVYTVAGTKPWSNSSNSAVANGYNGSNPEEHWLVLPGINLDNYSSEIMTFTTYAKFGTNDANNYLKLYYSTTYTGLGTPGGDWTELSFTQPEGINSTTEVSAASGNIDLSGISGTNVYLAFKYYSTNSPTQWRVDDISIVEATSPALSANPVTLNGFTYVEGEGPSTEQTVEVSGSNLDPADDNVTVTGSTNYEVSLDNTTYSASVQIPYTGGTLSATPVYVRLVSGLAIGTYNSEIITVSGGTATAVEITANGSVASPPIPIATFGGTGYSEDFSAFTGSGFSANPAAGQLHSGNWRVVGMSDGAGTFDGEHATGDFARGTSAGGVTTGGVYSFNPGDGSTVFGVQPTSSDFATGNITLRLQNETGNTLEYLDLAYDIYVLNNDGRSSNINFAYSFDDITYTAVSALDFATPLAADGTPAWVETEKSTQIGEITWNNMEYIYLQWQCTDNGGSGSRDEFGISNISLTEGTAPVPNYAVTFNVDMSDAVAKGFFDPAMETIEVAGNFTSWGDAAIELSKVGETYVYTYTSGETFAKDSLLEFKFRLNGAWDVSQPADNIQYAVNDVENIYDYTWTTPQITWANLQWPQTSDVNVGYSEYNVYARLYIEGITGAAAVGSIDSLQAWIGVNTTNATEVGDFAAGWTWVPATLTAYEGGFGDNSQFVANIASAASEIGTYYYVSRFQYGNDALVYGGYNGGYWDGSSNTSGVLTVNITDTYKVAEDKDALDFGDFVFDGTEDQNNVKSNFGLPGVGEMYSSAITWASNNTDVITIVANGENWTAQVTRPLPSGGKGDATVTLTATVNSNGTTDTKEFQVVVKEDLSSFVAALSTPGNKTTGVAFGISLTAAQDVDGNALVGDKTMIVSSSKDGVVFNDIKTFAAGATTVSVTLISLDTHTLTISVSGVTESETFDVVVEAAPTYSVSIKVGEAPVEASYGFGTKVLGYAPVAAETFTVTRTGDGDITGLAAALSGDNAGDFTITAVLATELTAVSPSTTFTVKPNDGLAVGTYTAQVDVTADNGVSESFAISFEVLTPTYTISLDVVDNAIDFGTETVGYESFTDSTVTISKTGNSDITNLSVGLSGDNTDAFVLSAVGATTLTEGAPSTTFTVRPADGLAYGTYNAVVTVTADNGVSEAFNVTFTVYSYQISLNADNPTVFETQYLGYAAFENDTVIVTRTANGIVTGLAVGLSGTNPESFTVTQPEILTLDNDNNSTIFTVKPNHELAVGQYAAIVTVTANNAIEETFNVQFEVLEPLSTEANITAFSFAEQTGAAVIGDGTIAIEVANGTNLTNLVATFTLSDGASVKIGETVQESGVTENDFTNVVTYVVTAEDGTTTKNWDVTVTEQPVYTVNYSVVNGNGTLEATVSANPIADGAQVEEGSNIDFVATPTEGYRVKEWTLNTAVVAGNTTNNYTISNIAANVTVTVEFEEIPAVDPLLLVEDFDYDAGTDLAANGWTAHSGTSNPILVVSPGLAFDGYIGSGIGNAAGVNNTGYDIHKTFAAQTEGVVYAAFVIKTEATNSAGYFLHLGQNIIGTTFFSRVWVNATGNGVGIGASAPTTYEPIAVGIPTLLVVKYDIATKVSSLYIFDTFPASEPGTANASFTETATLTDVGSIALRQYNASQRIVVDGIRVATTWEEAVKAGAVAPTYAVNFSVTGTNGSLAATVDGSSITTGQAVEEGKNVVFTATPDAGFQVKQWTLNSEVVADNTTNSYMLENLTAEATVTVEFEEIPPVLYAVTFAVTGENGTLAATVDATPITTGDEVEEGSTVIFTATPADGYRVKEWTLNTEVVAGNTTNTYTIENLAAASAVTVEFELIPATTYAVTFSVVGENGTLSAKANGLDIISGGLAFEGDDVVFTAAPDAGFRVKEWTLNTEVVAGNTTNTLSVLGIAAPATVTVEFEAIPQYTLTVNVAGNGAVSVDGIAYTEAVSFYEGTIATVVATPDAGWQFDSWTGDVAEALEASTTVTMDADKAITATFTEIPVVYYTVNYSVVNGNGILEATVSANPIADGAQVEEGSNIDFVATPTEGYRVKEWTLNTAVVAGNTTNNYTISNIAANATVTVEFEEIPVVDPLLLVEDFDYDAGTDLAANGWTAHSGTSTPILVVSPGLEFSGYLGSGIGNAAGVNNTGYDVHRTFTAQTEGAVYAAFVIKTEATNSAGYFLHLGQNIIGTTFFSRVWVNATGNGVGIGASAPTTYEPIAVGVPTLLVVKYDIATKVSSLYIFDTFPASEPGTANASFTETATLTDVGSIALRQYNASQRVVVDGIRVATTWEEAVKSGVVAPTYAVNFSVVGMNGSLAATVDGSAITTGQAVEEGKNVVFTATPDAGFRVKEWTLNTEAVADNTTNTYTLENLTAEATVTVEFEEIPPVLYAVTFAVTGENGTLAATVDATPITTGDEVEEGSTIVFTATPADGYRVKEWTLNTEVVVGNTTNTYTIENLAAASAVTVEFELIPATTYAVTFSVVGENGALTAKANGISINSGDLAYEGDDVVFTAIPDAGFRVKEWTLNAEVVVGNITNTFTIENIAAVSAVTVEFEAIPQYTLTVNVAGNGGVTVDGTAYTEAVMFYEGTVATVVATPDAGWQFDSWTGDVAEALEASTTVTMDADKAITATFTEIPVVYYTVNFSVVNGNGTLEATVSANPITDGAEVEEGSTVDFVATPTEGYRVKEWTLNTAVVAGNTTNNYTISNIAANATVTVEFEEIPAVDPVLLTENFDYVAGTYLTANSWTAHSGAGTMPITVVSPGLEFNGYLGSGIGNAAALSNNGEDVNKQFEGQTEGTIYSAFIVKTESTNSAGYFFHYAPSPFATTYFSRVWVNADGSGLGIGGTTPSNYVAITPGVPTLVVAKIDLSTKVSSLFVFNTFPASEPATADQTFTEAETVVSVGAIGLRQYNASQRVVVDGIRIATTWDEAVKSGVVAPTYAVNYSVVGMNGSLAATVDGSAITTGQAVEEGKNVVFTATPDAGYRVKEWTLNSEVVADNTTNTYMLENLTAEATVTVEFEEIPPVLYAVTFAVTGENGTLAATVDATPITTGDEVEEGSTVIFTATPADGYRVKEWTLNTEVVAGNTTNTYTLENLAAAAAVTVEFELIPTTTYAVTFSVVGENGALTAKANGISINSGDLAYEGDDVVFTAVPDAGFRVKEWTLNAEVVVGNITNTFSVLNIAAAATVTVEFEAIPQYTLTVNVAGNGAVSVDGIAYTEAVSFYEGTVATVVATPDAGWQFDSWTGDVAEALEASTTVTMDADKAITATFTEIPVVYYTVNFSVVNGNGTLDATVSANPITNGAEVEEGSTVDFVATPTEGYRVKEWTLNTAVVAGNTTNNYTIGNLAADATVTVEFEEIPVVNPLLLVEDFDYSEGSDLADNGWTIHSGNDNPLLVVSPGLEFDGYMGSGIGNAVGVNNVGIDMHRTFAPQTEGAVYAAFVIKTEANNAAGYFLHFATNPIATTFINRVWVNASGDGVGVGMATPTYYAPISVGVPTLLVIKYDFATKVSKLFVFNTFPAAEPETANASYTETATISNVGSIALRQYNAAQGVVVDGIRVATTWEEAVKASGSAVFYTVDYGVSEGEGQLNAMVDGTSISTGQQIAEGKDVSFTATPAEGFKVLEWKLNNEVVADNTTNSFDVLNLSTDIDVSVAFTAIPQYTASITIVGNGYVNVNGELLTGPITVYEGTELTLEAVPATNWGFEGWTGDFVSASATETIVVNSDMNITATFVDQTVYHTVAFAASANGTVEATVDGNAITSGQEIAAGSEVVFAATPADGYRVKMWTMNGTQVDGNSSNTLIVSNLDENIDVFVEFELLPENQYTVTFSVINENGSLEARVDNALITSGDMIYEGEGVVFTAVPNYGFRVKEWIYNGNMVVDNSTNTFVISSLMENSNVTVEFEAIPQFTLTIVTVGNGDVTVDGEIYSQPVVAFSGSELSLVAVPDASWTFESWTGDITSTNATETITLTQDMTITATFVEEVVEYTLTVNVVGEGTVTANGEAYTMPITATQGSEITLVATAAEAWLFEGWSGDVTNANETVVVTLNQDMTVTANFRAFVSATINPTSGDFYENEPEDLSTVITWNDAQAVTSVVVSAFGELFTLVEGEDYTITDIDGATALLTFVMTGEKFRNTTSRELEVMPCEISFDAGESAIYTINYNWEEEYYVMFNVTSSGSPVENAQINIDGGTYFTDANGQAELMLIDGSYPFEVIKDNYVTYEGTVVVDGSDQTVNVVLVSGINSLSATTIRSYPNPVVDMLTLNRETSGNVVIEIYSVNGSLVHTQEWTTETLTLNLNDLKTGLFTIRVTGNGKVETLRFVKQ